MELQQYYLSAVPAADIQAQYQTEYQEQTLADSRKLNIYNESESGSESDKRSEMGKEGQGEGEGREGHRKSPRKVSVRPAWLEPYNEQVRSAYCSPRILSKYCTVCIMYACCTVCELVINYGI